MNSILKRIKLGFVFTLVALAMPVYSQTEMLGENDLKEGFLGVVSMNSFAASGFNIKVDHDETDPEDPLICILLPEFCSVSQSLNNNNSEVYIAADDVRFIGTIGADPGVIAVAKDSSFQDLPQLVNAIRENPKSVTFAGGSSVGGVDHLKPLMLLKQAGFTDIAKINYIGLDGGTDAINQTVGGFTQAITGNMSEVVDSLKSGHIRVIAVLTEERVPSFEDIPTAKEQGYDFVAVNWRGMYAPKSISEDKFDIITDRLRKVATSQEWTDAMVKNNLVPFIKVGDDFQAYLDKTVSEAQEIYKELGIR